jgi:cation diffusion facilitator CzcD-associated flavoprotein CzcO
VATRIDADYLVIGAGAMGIAFSDTLVTETNATVAVVDRHHQPGGHWTMASPLRTGRDRSNLRKGNDGEVPES